VAHLTPAHTVNEQDASQYDGMSVAWHRKARRHGRGSAYLRIGRTIRYRIEARRLARQASRRTAGEPRIVSDASRSRMADLIMARLTEILQRLARIEQQQTQIADDLDALDRGLRPYGDGTKIRHFDTRRKSR